MLHLYQLKIGESALQYFSSQAEQSNFHDSIYILPSKILTREVKKQYNIQTGTLDSLVSEILQLGTEHTPRPISNFTRELLLEKLILDLQKQEMLTYFQNTPISSSLLESVSQFVSEISSHAITSNELVTVVVSLQQDPSNAASADKLNDLNIIYTTYKFYLQYLGEVDIFERYSIAANLLEELPPDTALPWKNIYISDYYSLTPQELEIIKQLSLRSEVEIALVYENDRSDIFMSLFQLHFSLIDLLAPGRVIKPEPLPVRSQDTTAPELRFLTENFYKPQANTWSDISENIRLHGFHDKNQELLYIVSDIKQKLLDGAQPEDFMLLTRDLNEYANLSEFFKRVGVVSSLPKIIRVHKHFISRLITDLLALVALPFNKTRLQKVLFAPPFVAYLQLDKDKLEKIFYEYSFDSFPQLKNVLVHAQQNQSLNLQPEIDAVDKLQLMLKDIPYSNTALGHIQTIRNILSSISLLHNLGLDYQCGRLSSEQLKSALEVYQSLDSVLDTLHNSLSILYNPNQAISTLKFSQYLSKALLDKTITLEQGNNQNAIKVIQASDVQSLKVRHLYILGLNDGVFPKYKKENWLFNARDINSLFLDVIRFDQSASEDAYFFTNALGIATNSLTLTYLDNERDRVSKYIQEIKRLIPDLHTVSHRNMLPDKPSDIYDAHSLSNYLAFELARGIQIPVSGQDWLTKKWQAPPCDLIVLPENNNIDIDCLNKGSLHFSITQLEDYANCPFRYLVNHVWHTDSWRLSALDNTALTKGSFLHKVAEQFVQKHINNKLPTKQKAIDELQQLFETAFAAMPAENSFTWSLSKGKMWQILYSWLEQEYQDFGEYIFHATEWEFGNQGEFIIANLPIRGKIDRIDISPSAIRITDYKYKNIVRFKSFEDNRTNLQVPLYMLAVDSLLNNNGQKQLVGNYYSFVKTLTGNYLDTKVHPIEMIQSNIQTIVSDLADGIHAGIYTPTSNPDCKYCEYASACRVQKSTLQEEEESE